MPAPGTAIPIDALRRGRELAKLRGAAKARGKKATSAKAEVSFLHRNCGERRRAASQTPLAPCIKVRSYADGIMHGRIVPYGSAETANVLLQVEINGSTLTT